MLFLIASMKALINYLHRWRKMMICNLWFFIFYPRNTRKCSHIVTKELSNAVFNCLILGMQGKSRNQWKMEILLTVENIFDSDHEGCCRHDCSVIATNEIFCNLYVLNLKITYIYTHIYTYTFCIYIYFIYKI